MSSSTSKYQQKIQDYLGVELPDSFTDIWYQLSLDFKENPVETAMNTLPDELLAKWLKSVVLDDLENINKLI